MPSSWSRYKLGDLIVINPDGSVSVLQDNTQGPYDSVEDTLVGVLDNCPGCGTITSLPISSPSSSSPPIFGLDGDGACSGFYSPNPPAADCPGGAFQTSDPADYESNNVTFSGIDQTTSNSGTLNFSLGLTNGQHAWFSLENVLTAQQVTVTTTLSTTSVSSTSGVPQFGTPIIFVVAAAFLGLTLFLRVKKSSPAPVASI